MEAIEILNALMSGMEVKVKEDVFNFICEDEDYKPNNCFAVYQIEQGSVNLYNELTEEVYYEVLFDDISLF